MLMACWRKFKKGPSCLKNTFSFKKLKNASYNTGEGVGLI